MASKYSAKQAAKLAHLVNANVKGLPSQQPFMKGVCPSGVNVVQHRKASKRLRTRIKDYSISMERLCKQADFNPASYTCPGSMQVR